MWKAELVLKRKIRSRSHRVGIVDVGTYMPVGEGKEEREKENGTLRSIHVKK